ncbi:MAG: NAD-dependent epimerase/dehydratase family protein [Succinivibrio sp.]|nr:NAD-dependent epimerase/dehydratase family protein [Succinivibrio sp.]
MMKHNKKALITGGCGYFGSVLTAHLAEQGYDCTVLDLYDTPQRPQNSTFIQGDIRNERDLAAALKGCDLVFHTVSQQPLAKDPALFESVNIGGTQALLKSCRAVGVQKLCYISSTSVYGIPDEDKLPVTEETPCTPAEAYGRTKLAAEELVKEAALQGLDSCIIRPRTIVGPGRLGIFSILFDWIADGHNIPVLGRGDKLHQFIDAGDLAKASLLAALHEAPGQCEVFNVGTSRFGTMRQMLEEVCTHAGTGSKVKSVPFKPVQYAMRLTSALGLSPLADYHWMMYGHAMYFSTDKLEKVLGFAPAISNTEMMCAAYDWYLEHRKSLHYREGIGSPHQSNVKQKILNVAKHFF